MQFGLANFRGVVQAINSTHAYKFFCCNNNCPGSTAADKAGFADGVDEHHLFNVLSTDSGGGGGGSAPGGSGLARFDSPAADLRKQLPDIVAELAAALPAAHQTASNPNSSIPAQSAGYTWRGCRLYPAPPAPPAIGGFQGCFVDKTSTNGQPDHMRWDPARDLQLNKGASNAMTPALCVQWCKEGNATRGGRPFKYAGVQAGTFCLCGDSYGRYGAAALNECNMPCPGGSKGEMCGAHLRHDVYDTTPEASKV